MKPIMMIDLETLGLGTNSTLIEIAAIILQLSDDYSNMHCDMFSVLVNPMSQPESVIQQDTIDWHYKTDNGALMQLAREVGLPISQALKDINRWVKSLGIDPDNLEVWSNGANFDEPLLRYAMEKYGDFETWQSHYRFYNVNCYRTAMRPFFNDRLPVPSVLDKHCALHDCAVQTANVVWHVKGIKSTHHLNNIVGNTPSRSALHENYVTCFRNWETDLQKNEANPA